MTARPEYEQLGTERANRASRALDRMTPLDIARLMNREDTRAVRAIARALPTVARAVDAIVQALSRRGRLFIVGAGTSGRLAVLEAAECPPTFGTSPSLVQAIMAGGRRSVFRSREGAEDDAAAAARAVRERVRRGDAVVGVSASGVTPFVQAALVTARRRGAMTVLVACNPARQILRGRLGRGDPRTGGQPATLVIALRPGPEVLAGSTRLKAGTVTKLVLNMLTTASMVRLGRVYGNRMVDLQPRSRKLRERALRLVQEIARVSRPAARRALAAARGRVRLAVVMASTGLGAREASRALEAADGSLRRVLEGSARR
jgi:N-acetylmuramic acid 6-phosphate etherase